MGLGRVRLAVAVVGLASVLGAQAAWAQCSSTAAITCGETKNGSLSAIGETDCFTFDASMGETVSIATEETAGVFQSCWILQGPNGSLGGACGQAERTLPDTGTYTIQVHDNGDNETGSYDVNLVFVSDTASNCGETIACADTLARGIAAVAESDTFHFAALAGDTVSITVQETGGGLSGCWELYDPTGASLGGLCGQTEKTLAVPGGYTIRVADNTNSKTGTYDVNLVFVSDSASSCAEPIACGQTLARATTSVGESDTFKFSSAAGETVSITAQETGGGTASCWDLYDPTGSVISSGCGQNTRTLAVAGQYSIRVHDSTETKTGTYDVNLVFISDSASNCAEPILCGQPLARDIASVAESDTFRFTALAGDTVSITSQQTSAFLDACWEIYDPQGISVIGACGQSQKTLAVAGNYTIRVYDNGDSETGTYDIDLVVVSDSAATCAEPIVCGDTLARNVATVGESDTFRFLAAAGETVSVVSVETGGFMNACWEIYDPAGISLGTSCGQLEKTLAIAGGYTIRVYDDNDSETGTYDVGLVVVSDTAHSCAVPLACGETATGSIDAKGGALTYRVAGQTGDVVKIDTQEIGGNMNACWEFYDPAGASLGGVCGADDRTLATNLGGYTVRVYDQGDNDTGDFQVTLCNPTTTTTTITSGSTTTTTLGSAGDQLLRGAKLLLKDSATKPQKRRLLLLSRDVTISIGGGRGSLDDPTQYGGALRVRGAAGTFDANYVLEPIGWRLLKRRNPGKGWKYTHGNAVKLAIVQTGRQVRIVGRGPSLSQTLATSPDPVDVVLSLGSTRYCFQFGGAVKFAAGKSYLATNAPAPAACPAQP